MRLTRAGMAVMMGLCVIAANCGDNPPPLPPDLCEQFPELCEPAPPAEGWDCEAESQLTGVIEVEDPGEVERYIVVLAEPSAAEIRTLSAVVPDVQALAPQSLLARRVGLLESELGVRSLQTFGLVGPRGGFLAEGEASQLRALAERPGVQYLQRDGRKEAWEVPYSNDRSNERERTIDGDESTGDGKVGALETLRIGVNDTGTDLDHPEFEDRIDETCFSAVTFGGCEDLHNHGTHVASNIIGKTFGILKSGRLVSLRSLDENGSGTDSGVISMIEAFTDYCEQNGFVCVGNMSLGGGASPALDTAVCQSQKRGVLWVVAAGNDGTDACRYSPARVKQALTVGAINHSDGLAGFSNRGACVDVLAVGDPTRGAVRGGGSDTMRGTSMASPEAAAVAGLEAERDPAGSPADWKAAVLDNATEGVVSGVPEGTPNLLIYSQKEGS